MKKLNLVSAVLISACYFLPNCSTALASEDGNIVASCTNSEATYQFRADEDGNIEIATLARVKPSAYKMNCKASRGRGEVVYCTNELLSRGDVLVLYREGYAIMHFNTDSDSNNDGDRARCKGSYFK